jgi:hypothetical protein
MLTLRLGMALLTTILVAFAIYYAPNHRDFWLYYSHWSLMLLLVMFVWGSAVSLTLNGKRPNDDRPTWYARLYGVLVRVTCTANLLSTAIYFIITFSFANSTKRPVNHIVHTANSLAVLVEVVAGAVPIRLVQVYQPLLYTLAYGAFAALYHHYTSEAIYKCLHWDNQIEMSRYCTGIISLMFAMYMLMYTIRFIKFKCNNTLL